MYTVGLSFKSLKYFVIATMAVAVHHIMVETKYHLMDHT